MNVFCIVIPLLWYTTKGTWYEYEEKYECFKSKEICSKKLSVEKRYLKKFQNSNKVHEPYCKSEANITELNIDEENIKEKDKKSWYNFWQ